MRRFALLLLLAGCSTKTAPTASDAGVAVDAAVPDAAVEAAAALSPDDDARRIVHAWSDALDRHDIDALDPLYAKNVYFYTSLRTKAQVLAAKRSVLPPGSTFHQEIVGDITITDNGGGTKKATFTKRSGSGKLVDSPAILILGGTPMAITQERDAPPPPASCEATLMSVVNAMPAVKKEMDATRANLAKTPDANEGGMGPEKQGDGSWTGALGVFHPDRFESIVQFSYAKGALAVTVMGDDQKASAADLAKLKAACH